MYIYDTRHSSPLHKLTGHSDVVSTLAYHPLRPMVCHKCIVYTITVAVQVTQPPPLRFIRLLQQRWMEKLVSYQNERDSD